MRVGRDAEGEAGGLCLLTYQKCGVCAFVYLCVREKVIQDNLNPTWPRARIPLESLTKGLSVNSRTRCDLLFQVSALLLMMMMQGACAWRLGVYIHELC